MLSKLATLVAAGGLLAGAATAALAVDTNDLETIRFGIIATDSAAKLAHAVG